MIAATLPAPGPLDPPVRVQLHGEVVELIRRHRAPKGKVTVEYRRHGGGVGQLTVDDTDRLDVVG